MEDNIYNMYKKDKYPYYEKFLHTNKKMIITQIGKAMYKLIINR